MNGYVEITLGGKPRALKFNMHAIEILSTKGQTPEIDNDGNVVQKPEIKESDTKMFQLSWYIYAGLCGQKLVSTAGVKPVCDETFEEIMDMCDECLGDGTFSTIYAQVLATYYSSKPMQALVKRNSENSVTEEEKKN